MDQIERLCAVLAEETVLCSALAYVLRDEQRAVEQLRSEALVACIAERESLQARLLGAARARRGLVRAAAGERGASTSNAVDLLPLLPPGPRATVREHLRGLRRVLLAARSLERETARLVGDGPDGVSDVLRALRAFVPGADAERAAPATADRIERQHGTAARSVLRL
jgi:hypothetical protein